MPETIREVVARLRPDAHRGRPAPEHENYTLAAAKIGQTALRLLGAECSRNLLRPYLKSGPTLCKIHNNAIISEHTGPARGGIMSAESMRVLTSSSMRKGVVKIYNNTLRIFDETELTHHVPVYLGPGFERLFREIGTLNYCDSNYIRIPFPSGFVPVCVLPCGLLVGSQSCTTVQICELTLTMIGYSCTLHETSQSFILNTFWDDYGRSYSADSLNALISHYLCEYMPIRVDESMDK